MLKKILIGLAVVILAFVAFVSTRPAQYHVERSQKIAAPAEIVFAQLDDFRAWASWSPWEKLDPGMQKTYSGPARGVGASYEWQGNKEVGKGRMTITEAQPTASVRYRLEFIEPFSNVAESGFTLAAADAESTNVTWSMDGNNDFMGKAFGLFMDMDAMIGADFEKGLGELKAQAEAKALEQRKAREAAAAAAATAAQAPAQPAPAEPAP